MKDRKSLMKQYNKWRRIRFVSRWLFLFTLTATIITLIAFASVLVVDIVNDFPVTIDQFFRSWRSALGTLFCLISIYPSYRVSSYAKAKLEKYKTELLED